MALAPQALVLTLVSALFAGSGSLIIVEDGLTFAETVKELRDALYTPQVSTVAIRRNITISTYEWGWAIPNIQREVTVTTADDAPWPTVINTKSERELGFVLPGGHLIIRGVIFDEMQPQANKFGQSTAFPLFTSFPGGNISFFNCSLLQSNYVCFRLGLENYMTNRRPSQEALDRNDGLISNETVGPNDTYVVLHESAGPKEFLLYDDPAAQNEGWIYFYDTYFICNIWGLTSVKYVRAIETQTITEKHFKVDTLHELLNILTRGDPTGSSANLVVAQRDKEFMMQTTAVTVEVGKNISITKENWSKDIGIFFSFIQLNGGAREDVHQGLGAENRTALVFAESTAGKMGIEIKRDARMELRGMDLQLPLFVPRNPLQSPVHKTSVSVMADGFEHYHFR
ncbi:unnamed protein product, partial [Ostreobium quekettii]